MTATTNLAIGAIVIGSVALILYEAPELLPNEVKLTAIIS